MNVRQKLGGKGSSGRIFLKKKCTIKSSGHTTLPYPPQDVVVGVCSFSTELNEVEESRSAA